MIKKILIFLFIAISFETSSQTNLGFENWTFNGNYYELNDWFTSNLFVSLGSNLSCSRSLPFRGSYSLGICPFKVSTFDTLSGFAIQHFEYTKRTKSLSLSYHYNSRYNDSASIIILFYKGYSKDTNNIIGRSTVYLTKNFNWTTKSGDITWKNNLMPDSATITISNSQRNNKDTLFVDEITLTVSSNLKEQFNNNKLTIYPNPVDCILNIDIPKQELENQISISIYDIQGKLVKYCNFQREDNNKLILITSDIASGTYIVYLQGVKTDYHTIFNIQH